ncbi:hypothetical protein [Anaerovibrio slackiae]|uniref:Bbp19 family protein n=1 Tax=Anaerovibrio slackiae TaxID=2652309 RepID=UPI00386AB436
MEYAEMNQEIGRVVSENILSRDKAALEYVMSSPDGRWFVSRLLKNCHVYSALGLIRTDQSMVLDANAMMVQEGERRVGLILRQNILNMPDGVNLMHQMEKEAHAHDAQLAELRRSVMEKYRE